MQALFFFLLLRRPPGSTLFPYTTLFRSLGFLALAGVTAAEATQVVGALLLLGLVAAPRSEEHTSELQSHVNLVCRLPLDKKKSTADCLRPTSPPPRLLERLSALRSARCC